MVDRKVFWHFIISIQEITAFVGFCNLYTSDTGKISNLNKTVIAYYCET